MRHAAVAAAVCLFCLCQNAQAHGPSHGGHAGGGQAGGGQFHHNPGGGPAGVGGSPRASVGQLHPAALSGKNGGGNASSATASGTSSSGAKTGNASGSTASNAAAGGNSLLAGDIAKIHHLEHELRRLRLDEAMLLGGGNKPGASTNQLHSPLTSGINGLSGTASSGVTTGTTSGAIGMTSTGIASTGANLSGGGNLPLTGEIAKIHQLEEQLRHLKREESQQLLQQIKQSNNPQLTAKVEQMLQHAQQNHAQHGGNSNATVPVNQNSTKPTPASGGHHSGSEIHLSHSSPSGGHATAGHGKR